MEERARHVRHLRIGAPREAIILIHNAVTTGEGLEEAFGEVGRIRDDHLRAYAYRAICAALVDRDKARGGHHHS